MNSSPLDGLSWGCGGGRPRSFLGILRSGQPVTCFCILLVPTAPPCFWETQTIVELAVDLPELLSVCGN